MISEVTLTDKFKFPQRYNIVISCLNICDWGDFGLLFNIVNISRVSILPDRDDLYLWGHSIFELVSGTQYIEIKFNPSLPPNK